MMPKHKSLYSTTILATILSSIGCATGQDPFADGGGLTDGNSADGRTVGSLPVVLCTTPTQPYSYAQELPEGETFRVEVRERIPSAPEEEYQGLSVIFHTNVPVRTVTVGADYQAFVFLDGVRQVERWYNERLRIGVRGVTDLPDVGLDCHGNKIYAYSLHIGFANTYGTNYQQVGRLLTEGQSLSVRIDICNRVTCVGGTTITGVVSLH